MQCPRIDNPGEIRHLHVPLDSASIASSKLSLPDSFRALPAVQLDTSKVAVPNSINNTINISGHLENARAEKYLWTEHSMELLHPPEVIS
jgi:hypothetical protein